ncbi:flavin reductase family protein [Arthrobacter sp. RHLT1-20]
MIATEISPQELRQVCGEWATGVAVVTSVDPQGKPVGMAVNSFTSVSLDPPLVLFCPAKGSSTWSSIREAGSFAVNILGAHQTDVMRSFARSGADKFVDVPYSAGRGDVPLLDGVAAYLLCTTESVHEAGDHEIVVGRVVDTRRSQVDPLVFHRGTTNQLTQD